MDAFELIVFVSRLSLFKARLLRCCSMVGVEKILGILQYKHQSKAWVPVLQ
jgi:hypothetical protein